jgi:hypothetical protein
LFLATLVAPTRPARSEQPPPAGERLRADVTRLAGEEWQGRRAGSPGAERAANWIAGQFRRIGLAPGGSRGSYLQAFSFIDGVVLGPRSRLSTGAGGPATSWKPSLDFRPLAFSAAGSARGEVVFAGYGIVAKDLGYDDYEGLDVRDRIVLLLRQGPDGQDPQSRWAAFTSLRQKAWVAREKGAAGVLFVLGPRTEGDELAPLRSDASLTDAGLPLVSVRRAVTDAWFAAASTTLEAAQRAIDESGRPRPLTLPGARAELVTDVSPRRATTHNVVGVLGRGTEALVVGAHYDHLGTGAPGSLEPSPEGKVHHGADDNASGVAGLLELARRLAARREPLARRIVFVAFGAEELGVLGSTHFVKEPPVPWPSVAAMINLDMIGRLRQDTLDLHGVGTSPVWKGLVEESNRAVGLRLRYREGGYGPSDHSPFYAAGKPVLAAFTGVHSDYHKPSDTADKVDVDGIDRIVSLLEPVLASLASSPSPVAFTRVAAEKDLPASGGRGFRVWVGGVPDYADEGPGVRFTGVTPGSPAEKAGVQAGDVLVRFGAMEIRNIYDYTYALGEHRPGDVIKLTLLRGGREVILDVVLAARPRAGE